MFEAVQPLAKDDPECAAIVLDQLAREGIVIRSGINIARIQRARPKVQVVLEGAGAEETIEGTHLLVAAGRRPTVEGLDLEAGGIQYGDRGIFIDVGLRTTNRRVYAIGDVAGPLQFTHFANYQAGLVIRNALFRQPVVVNEDAIPRVTFTDPGTRPCGTDRGGGSQARRDPRAALALP